MTYNNAMAENAILRANVRRLTELAEARATAVMTHAAGIEELEDKQEYLCTDNQWLTSEVERLTQELAEARATAWDEGTRVTFAYLTHGASWTVNPYRAATPAREEPK